MNNDQFWKTGRWRMLFHATNIITHARQEVTPQRLMVFIKTAPRSTQKMIDDYDKDTPFFNHMKTANSEQLTQGGDQDSISQSLVFWCEERRILVHA